MATPETSLKTIRGVLNYLWNETDVEPGNTKVCDLFPASDPMAVEIADILEGPGPNEAERLAKETVEVFKILTAEDDSTDSIRHL